MNLLFIHHSCGGQLLANPGPEAGANCIYSSHPNGGGLRQLLEQASYTVREASYGSQIGQSTDVFDWPVKFHNQMQGILSCGPSGSPAEAGQPNQIVMFKSCFPNNDFESVGRLPGRADGPGLTVCNAKAAYLALLDEFRKQPKVLFVCVTAPPLAPQPVPQPLWKALAGRIVGRDRRPARSAVLARQFNNWLAGTDGWLNDYNLTNVVVFDYYDILTDHGASNLSRYPTGGGCDSHPSAEGNSKAAEALVPFLSRAVTRLGLGAQRRQKNFAEDLVETLLL